MNNQEILEKLKQGDDEIFKTIYLQYRVDFILWLNSKFRIEKEHCTEIYQGAVVRLYDNVVNGKLTSLSSNLKTYLFAIGKNMALEHHRKLNKSRILPQVIAQQLRDDEINLDPLFHVMYASLEELGEPCKSVIEKHYFLGLNSSELAEQMGYKNANTAKTKKFKCLQKLIQIAQDKLKRQSN